MCFYRLWILQNELILRQRNKNVVFHVINGLFNGYDKLANNGFKLLILGYKTFGRGKDYFNKQIADKMAIDLVVHEIASFKLMFFCFNLRIFEYDVVMFKRIVAGMIEIQVQIVSIHDSGCNLRIVKFQLSLKVYFFFRNSFVWVR